MREIFYKKVYENFDEIKKEKQMNVKISKFSNNKLQELSNISNSNILINNNLNINTPNNNIMVANDNTNFKQNDIISVSKLMPAKKLNNENSKNETKIHNFKDLEISFFEYFIFIFCQCFKCNFNEKYGKLMKNIYFCVEKKDVIYITRKLIEIEKIKEVLFDKDQLAEFNNINNLIFLESECSQQDKILKFSSNIRGSTRLRLI